MIPDRFVLLNMEGHRALTTGEKEKGISSLTGEETPDNHCASQKDSPFEVTCVTDAKETCEH